jgi:leucyl aminopeptidase
MFKRISIGRPSKPVTVVLVASDHLSGPAEVKASLATPGFKAENGEVLPVGAHHVLLGVGASKDISAASMRLAAARLVRHLDRRASGTGDATKGAKEGATRGAKQRAKRASTLGASLLVADALGRVDSRSARASGKDSTKGAAGTRVRSEPASVLHERLGRSFAEALLTANWRFEGFDGSAAKRTPADGSLMVTSDNAAFTRGLELGTTLGEAMNFSRTIGATPPNVCNPNWVAAEARKLARATGLTCTVIDHAKAKKLGMGGLVAVGHGSASKSCLIHLVHKPKRVSRRARGQKLALVGKTLTYDTGGYSLKVNNGMKGMKYDKLGGTAVLGAMRAIAELDLPIEVHAVLAAAENMVSDDAMRPDDIIRISNGVTVEITNTDAEGRLVLADALVYAERTIGATTIVDMATLTGGVVVALGHFCAGYFCNDEALRARIEDAARETGEKVWHLPLWQEHRDFMRSQHADLINSNPQRSAHPIQGAAFLSYFVTPETPWAHIDIAGMGNVDSATDLAAPGPTGYGVRLLTELAADMAG